MTEIETLMQKQKEFFKEGKTKKLEFRLLMLKKLKNALLENENQFVTALEKDLGKSACETFISEYSMCISEVNFAIKNLKKWASPKKKKAGYVNTFGKAYEVQSPRGVCLIISTWNYPLYLAVSPLISCIAAGNCAVLKLSEYSVATSIVVANMIVEQFGENYIAVVQGGKDSSEELLEQKFDFVFFTGSSGVGKKILEKCAVNLTPAVLELGGKNPCIVMADCNIKKAARHIVWGKFLNVGQTCVAPDYVLAENKIKDRLLNEIITSIHEFYTDRPLDSIDYGKVISMSHFNRIVSLLSDGEIVFGGNVDSDKKRISPTVIQNIKPDSKLLTEEIFGPILPIIGFDDFHATVDELQKADKPLSAYIFSSNKSNINYAVNSLDCGNMCINDTVMQLTAPGLSFGGVGASGMGKSHGEDGFKAFSHFKSVLNRSYAVDIELRYPPYGGKLLKIKKKLIK